MAVLDLAAHLPPGLQRRLSSALSARWGLAAVAGAAIAVALAAALWLWSGSDGYAVLYAGLAAEDGGRAIAALQKLNIPYRVSEGGRVIRVPQADLGRARLQLALRGVPKADTDRWAALDSQSLGVSPFVEHVHYARAVESTLSHSIRQVEGVISARVELALPKPTAFLADTAKPSASVMLQLMPGVTLTDVQVAGIAGLVAASVPGLAQDRVTIVDQSGKVLSHDSHDELQQVPRQLAIAHEIERRYQRSIGSLLTPLLGPGNFRVSVAADIDFSRAHEASIKYGADHVLSQDETIRRSHAGPDLPIGIPGALSNRPPQTPTTAVAPSATAGAKSTASGGNASGGQQSGSKQSGSGASGSPAADTHRTTNYDIDHTVEYLQHPSWRVRAISVAVLVNDRADDPVTGARVKAIKQLVSSAIGGDHNQHAEVVALPFAPEGLATAGAPRQVWLTTVELNGLLALAGILLLFGGLLPILRRIDSGQELLPAAPGDNAAIAGLRPPPPLSQITAQPSFVSAAAAAGSLPPNADPAAVRDLLLNQPARAAQIVKEWIARDKSPPQQRG